MTFTKDQIERYQRQMILPGFGEQAQERLLQARVLVIGAGGLGCPVLLYLAAAGVGTIGIADHDTVALHNLHRQVLYNVQHIDLSKAQVAAGILKEMNPELTIHPIQQYINNQNIQAILQDYDLVVDGSDNFETRYLVNDACLLANKPLVYGAISQFDGQVAVFSRDLHYRDLFPDPPKPGTVLNCAEAGVLGVLPGIIGSMMAGEVIKLVTGAGAPLIKKLLVWNSLHSRSYTLELSPSPQNAENRPTTWDALRATDYAYFCGVEQVEQLSPQQLKQLKQRETLIVIDIRELNETPSSKGLADMQLPLQQLTADQLPAGDSAIVFVCQTGKRSAAAVRRFSNILAGSRQLYSLQGGMLHWQQHT